MRKTWSFNTDSESGMNRDEELAKIYARFFNELCLFQENFAPSEVLDQMSNEEYDTEDCQEWDEYVFRGLENTLNERVFNDDKYHDILKGVMSGKIK